MFDLIKHRKVIAFLRHYCRKLPLFWRFYGFYWIVRKRLERIKEYPQSRNFLTFGNYPIPSLEFPVSQLCTGDQMLEPIYQKWCREIDSPARFSRKQWEFIYIIQALYQSGMLRPGQKGLGFGCGREVLPSLFAKYGCAITATDLDKEQAVEQGWATTSQHSSNLEELYQASNGILDWKQFQELISYKVVDMNNVPDVYFDKYNFVWSACALEHLGSLQHGFNFIRKSLRCLKPGGMAVHTTEFNLTSLNQTLETPSCSVYRKKDIENFMCELTSEGYHVEPLNFHVGQSNVDKFVDLPPYRMSPHIKLQLEQFTVTSIGLIIRKQS